MILSKNNLRVVEMTGVDKNIPVLDNVHVAVDGTTIGSNGRTILAVSPVTKEIRSKLKLKDSGLATGVTISSDAAKNILKNLPRDTLFAGLLEHCDIQDADDHVKVDISDGKRLHSIEAKKYSKPYIQYKAILTDAQGKQTYRVVINRKRLSVLLKTLEAVLGDDNESAAYLEFNNQDQLVIRGINHANGQRALAVMGTYQGVEGKWIEDTEWEKQFRKPKLK